MGEKKTTMMVLKVDLQCCRCYKKVKKVLCSIPEIQDQKYNEKENLVEIKVVSCSPEKIKQKLICKGCGCIKSVEIKKEPPPKPPPPKPPKPPTPTPTPTPPPPPPPPSKTVVAIPVMPFFPYAVCCGQCYGGGPCHCGCGGRGNPPEQPTRPCHCGCGGHCNPPKQPPAPAPAPPVHPPRSCCGPCSEGRPGGPCHYEGYGRPVCDSYSGGYYCQENPSGCTTM
ncbi:protein PYRICULARIA ORYZAE RESISTANCE 21 isoform X4 [Fagus crenata]